MLLRTLTGLTLFGVGLALFSKRVSCVLNGGHYMVFHTTPTHLGLRCVACGHATPGWQIGKSTLRQGNETPRNAEV
jgi:hypothetical protein